MHACTAYSQALDVLLALYGIDIPQGWKAYIQQLSGPACTSTSALPAPVPYSCIHGLPALSTLYLPSAMPAPVPCPGLPAQPAPVPVPYLAPALYVVDTVSNLMFWFCQPFLYHTIIDFEVS